MDASTKPVWNSFDEQAPQLARLGVHVVGTAPLLTHNPASMTVKKEAKRGSNIPDPEDEAENGAYRLDDGSLGLKGDAFISSMVGKKGAASAFKTKNRGTMKSRLAHITCAEELVALVYPSTREPIRSYVIDRQPAVVQGARVIRARPRFDAWAATFTIQFDPQLVGDPKIMLQILADAGSRIGVGDYRPRYGRFIVNEFCVF